MFVPRAHVHLHTPGKRGWFSSNSSANRRKLQRNLKWYECVRMPYLFPTLLGTVIGIVVFVSGAFMSFVGYNPSKFLGNSRTEGRQYHNSNQTGNNSTGLLVSFSSGLRSLAYIGPVFMGIGFFIMMIAVVLYCEIKEKYVCNILPKQNIKQVQKDVLYDLIIQEFRKNYFRGIQVPIRKPSKKRQKSVEEKYPTLFKALSISTPALIITPEVQRKWRDSRGISPTSSRNRKRKYQLHETWLKTASLPNIRARANGRHCSRSDRKHNRRMEFQNRISKSCDHHGTQEKSLDTDKDDMGSCFDNPAFRISPTDPTPPHIQISPPTSPETQNSDTCSITEVSVHVDGDGCNYLKPLNLAPSMDTRSERPRFDLLSPTGNKPKMLPKVKSADNFHSDSRGFTMKRKLYPQSCIDIPDECSDRVVSLDNVAVRKNLQCQRSPEIHKKDTFVRYSKPGPYRTLIGVFRSESCLDRIRTFKPNEYDNDSIDSLTLTEDNLRNFEMTEFPKG